MKAGDSGQSRLFINHQSRSSGKPSPQFKHAIALEVQRLDRAGVPVYTILGWVPLSAVFQFGLDDRLAVDLVSAAAGI